MKQLKLLVLGAAFALTQIPAISSADPLGSAEMLNGAAKMEIEKAVRKNNVVTIKGKVQNTGQKDLDVTWDPREFFLIDEEKGVKYFSLKDENDRALVSNYSYPGLRIKVDANQSNKFWIKFSAPPAEVKKINLVFEKFEIIEDLAISDEG